MTTEQTEASFMKSDSEVDDRRFPPGHRHRANGVRVSATVYLRDHGPSAEDPVVTTLGGGEPLPADVQFALSLIEQEAWGLLHAMDESTYDESGDIT